jgi:hypothetical protein
MITITTQQQQFELRLKVFNRVDEAGNSLHHRNVIPRRNSGD